MKKRRVWDRARGWLGGMLLAPLFAAASCPGRPLHAQNSICAQVRLEILQKATLERVAFDARLGIANSLASASLSQLSVTLSIKDSSGKAADGLFFVKVNSLSGTTAVDGTGVIQPAATANVQWLIIPSTGAGGTNPLGTRYFVKATVNFLGNGFLQTMATFDAPIAVLPQPLLRLQYVLPRDVEGDDPFTEAIETAVPYQLGLRVVNEGFGPAKNLVLDSGQPRIVDNQQGLAVDFKILGTFVGTATVANTLQLPFGDIEPGGVKLGSWQMISSLRGRFIDFTASFTHAPELGGTLTSLIGGVSTYFLIKDVLDDRPGRDSQFDFLISTAGTLSGENPEPHQLFSSDVAPLFQVTSISSQAVSVTGTLLATEPTLQMSFTAPAATGFYHILANDPTQGSVPLAEVRRSDGKQLHPRNFWQNSPYYKPDAGPAPKLIRIFDFNPTGAYTLVFRKATLDVPPDPVTNLSASTTAFGAALLSWTSTGEDRSAGTILSGRYAIEFSTNPSASFSTASAQIVFSTHTPSLAPQGLVVSDLLGNATYYFRIWTADNGLKFSDVSNGAAVMTLPYPSSSTTISDVTPNSFAVSWSTAMNLTGTGYKVDLTTLPAGIPVSSVGFALDLSSHAFTGLDPNTTHYVSALARNSAGAVTAAVTVSTTVTLAQPPLPAAVPLAAVHASSADLAWGGNGNPDSTRYEVLIATALLAAPISIRSFTGVSSGTVTSLTPDTTHHFSIRAVSHAGIPTSEAVLGSTLTSISPPQGSLASISPDAITVSWTASNPDNPSSTRYTAELSTASDFSGAMESSATTRGAGQATVGGLAVNTTYYVRLAVVGISQKRLAAFLGSAYTAQVFIPAGSPGVLSVASDTVRAAWGKASNTPGTLYNLQASIASDFSGDKISSATALSTATLSGLTPNTTYYLRVNAGIGESSSAFVSLGLAVTHAAPPALAPVPFTDISSFSITGAWSYSFTAQSFQLDASTDANFAGAVLSSTTLSSSRPYLIVSDLLHNTTYHLRVTAFNWQGIPAATVLGSTRTALPPPGLASQTVAGLSTSTIHVQWGSGGNDIGTLYTLTASTAPDFSGALITSATPATSATLSNLAVNTIYHLRVGASLGSVLSAATPLGPISTLAEAPSSLPQSFLAVFGASATVAWAAFSGSANGYLLEASGDSGFGAPISTLTYDLSLSTLTLTGLAPNTLYFFRVGTLNHFSIANYILLGSTQTTSQAHASTVIGADGGAAVTVVPPSASAIIIQVTVEAPPNALPPGAVLTVNADPQEVPPPISHVARLTPLGGVVDVQAAGAQPSAPVRIKGRYDPARIPSHIPVAHIKLAYYDPAKGRWNLLPSQTDSANNEVLGRTTHFTLFAFFGVSAAPNLDSALLMPVPWQPGSGDASFDAPSLSVRNLPFPCTVSIYNLLGERVWQGEADSTGNLEWSGVNHAGNRVGSGVYPVVLEGAGGRVKKRIVVIR